MIDDLFVWRRMIGAYLGVYWSIQCTSLSEIESSLYCVSVIVMISFNLLR